MSKSRVHRLTLKGEHTEHALVNPPERFAPHEALKRLYAQGKLAQGEAPLGREPPRAQPFEVTRHVVFRAVDYAQVLGPAALDRGLHQAAPTPRHEVVGLDHHTF